MKAFAVFSILFAAASAKPSALLTPVAIATPITSSQFHAQDEFGQYTYGYSNSLSSKTESKTLDGITRGGYSYIDAEGKLQSVEYTSDAINGFRIKATNLPLAPVVPELRTIHEMPKQVEDTPEVAEAKARHMEELEKAKARADVLEVETPAAVIPAALPYFHQPILPFAYSYGIPNGQFSTYTYGTPAITTYTAPFVAPIAAHIPTPMAPIAPSETPEVAKARAEHLAEVEKVKARNS